MAKVNPIKNDSYLNKMTYSMAYHIIDWPLIDTMDDTNPTSYEQRKLMRRINVVNPWDHVEHIKPGGWLWEEVKGE